MKSTNKISIITVCYNCEDSVEITLNSLINQTYQDFEYIVIDGKSTDNTLNVMQEYCKKLKNVTIISEKDNGIYDAMNKGINLATGEFIYFLNIKDKFYNNHVLEDVVPNLEGNIIYYGDAIMKKNKKKKFPNKITPLYFIIRGMICHQCIFAPSNVLKNNLFNTNYKYSADEDWLINAIKNQKIQCKHLNTTICYYDENGISSKNEEKVFEESINLKKKYYTKIFSSLFYAKCTIKKIRNRLLNKRLKYK